MDNEIKKLVLNQETLRNLLHHAPHKLTSPGTHTCHNGVCPSHNPPHCIGLAEAERQR